MTLIYSLRISVTLPSGRVAAKTKETSNVFQIMRKNFITFNKDDIVGSFINKEGKEVDIKN